MEIVEIEILSSANPKRNKLEVFSNDNYRSSSINYESRIALDTRLRKTRTNFLFFSSFSFREITKFFKNEFSPLPYNASIERISISILRREFFPRSCENITKFSLEFSVAKFHARLPSGDRSADFDIKGGNNRSHRCFHGLKGWRDDVSPQVAGIVSRWRGTWICKRVTGIESESRGYVTRGSVVIGAKSMGG